MDRILSVILLGTGLSLGACQQTSPPPTIPIEPPQARPNPHSAVKHPTRSNEIESRWGSSPPKKADVKPKSEKPREAVPAQPEKSDDHNEEKWEIQDDRFITTHDPDLSAEALGRSKESILKRLEKLETNEK